MGMGITVFAFSISGGVLLFIAALPMLFGHRPGLQSPERDEQGSIGEDIAIFPLAIPLLSGPGTITTILLLGNQAGANFKLTATLAHPVDVDPTADPKADPALATRGRILSGGIATIRSRPRVSRTTAGSLVVPPRS